MKLDYNQQAFFELLRAGLWADRDEFQVSGSSTSEAAKPSVKFYGSVDWEKVYQLAEEQSVIGLLLAGLEHSDVKPLQDFLLQWIGEVQIIEQQNLAMNKFVAQLIEELRKSDINTILVKGQGIAQCYEKPLWRASGDVDLLLSDENYIKAKKVLTPLALNVDDENIARKHLAMTIDDWTVELHSTMFGGWSKSVDTLIREAQDDCFLFGSVRSWDNSGTQVFLPSPNNDVIFVYTHILQHFFIEGIGLRQICDWCRLIWTYRDNLDLRLLEKRLKSAGLMPKWKAFAALVVEYLGMDPQIMPFYSAEAKWKKKADNILPLILETGNFGHARDMGYKDIVGLAKRLYISLKRHTHDGYMRARVFPQDGVRVWCNEMLKAVKSLATESLSSSE